MRAASQPASQLAIAASEAAERHCSHLPCLRLLPPHDHSGLLRAAGAEAAAQGTVAADATLMPDCGDVKAAMRQLSAYQ